MKRKHWIVLIIVGAVLIAAALLLFAAYGRDILTQALATPAPTPTLAPTAPALAVTPPPALEELSAQYPALAPILADPELGAVYKEFLIAYQTGGEAAALELARTRGLLTPDEAALRVTLVLDTEDTTPLTTQLEAIGVAVVSAYRDQVNIAVPLALIRSELASETPGAILGQLTGIEHVIAVRLPRHSGTDGSDIEGEGIDAISADAWHAQGITGAGVKIGVLDLGFSGYEDLLGVELPATVPMQTFGWYDESEVHGLACAEIVHEVAPDAELIFAWYDGSDAAFGEAVEWLLEQGVDIVTHSVGGIVGPRDGTGWDSRLVDEVAAQGVVWVNSAGNAGQSHYQALFTDTDGDGWHEFSPDTELLPIFYGDYFTLALMWEDSWEAAARDYDLYLIDENGDVLASSVDGQQGDSGQEPVEFVVYEGYGWEPVYVMIQAASADPVQVELLSYGGDFAEPTSASSITTPADAAGSLTVGAVEWWNDTLASYSSQGPTLDGRLKPEISAPTGVSGATYGPRGFDGTSASAPHVAGAAALVWQAHPEFARREVQDYLLAGAVDLGIQGPDTGYGYGLLQLSSPESDAAPVPKPPKQEPGESDLATSTPVVFVTAEPIVTPPTGDGSMGMIAVALVGGVGCCGMLFLVVGGVGLILLLRRPAPRPQPMMPPRPPAGYPGAYPGPVAPPPGPPPAPMRYPAPPLQAAPLQAAPPQAAPPQANVCRNCRMPLEPGARFCMRCGTPAPPQPAPQQATPQQATPMRVCPNCSTPAQPGSRFCQRCGGPLPQ